MPNTNSNKKVVPTATSAMKWWLSLVLGAIFFLYSIPTTSRFINGIWVNIGGPTFLSPLGSPTVWSVLIMTVFFILTIRLLLW